MSVACVAFVPAQRQPLSPFPGEIHTIAGTNVDSQFEDAEPMTRITSEAKSDPAKPDQDGGLRRFITPPREPASKQYTTARSVYLRISTTDQP